MDEGRCKEWEEETDEAAGMVKMVEVVEEKAARRGGREGDANGGRSHKLGVEEI